MRKILLTITLVAFASLSFSQQLSRYVVATGGNYSTASGISVSSTIGEPMVNTLTATGFILTQGFQQASITIYGCTDSNACNYDPTATIDDGSCLTSYGCTNPTALNYDPLATCDDGSCIAVVFGCTDSLALNYDSSANTNFACIYPNGFACDDGNDCTYNDAWSNGQCQGNPYLCDDGDSSTYDVCDGQGGCIFYGCTDPLAFNFNPTATADNGSCIALVNGCMDTTALNFNPLANTDDGSCMYPCTAAPYSENFDAGMGTWTTANTGSGNYTGWYSGTYTPSSATGPQSGDVTGGNFMYIETSSTGGPYTLTSECLDISALAAPALRYQYHMYGASMGTLDVTVNGDTLFTMSGDQGNQWNPHQIDLSAYVGTDITVEFIGSRGTSYTGDMAIDEVEVDEMTVLSIPGCMDPLALNYNSAANVSDSSCNYHCANTAAYASATADPYGAVTVSTCNYLTEYSTISGVGAGESYTASISGVNANPGYIVVYEGSSAGNFVAQGSAPLTWTSTVAGTHYIHWLVDSSCATATGCHTTTLTGNQILTVAGCMDALACNYDSTANVSDSSCTYPGCTDSIACNYDSTATCDDGSCLTSYGCTDLTACNYDSTATCDDGSCLTSYGCTDLTACNYDSTATCDDGSCLTIYGCTNPTALNYDPLATCDDGSCTSPLVCGAITGVNLTDVIHDRATFNWDDMNNTSCVVDQIRIRYREVGTNSYSTKTMGSPVGNNAPCLNTSKLILNLNASTQYEYNFKIWYQDGTNVTWHAAGTFTTLDVCDNVINITATPVNTTKTTFCWDSVTTYSFVRLQYRENIPGSSFSNIGGMGVISPTLCKDKNGLTPGTDYRVMWRTWCNPSGGPYRSAQWDGPVIWTQPTSIRVEGGAAINNLDVYPNPSRDIFNVTFTSEDVQDLDVRIINVIGEVVYTENLNEFVGEYTKQVDLSTYTKGVYFLEITTDNGVINKKLILQ